MIIVDIVLVIVVGSFTLNVAIAYQLRKVMDAVNAAAHPKPGRKWCRIHRQNFDVTSDSIECPKCKDR